ncbi:MAG: hypothetical protein HY842_12330 [Bacteroidetes bacterium]|nr:hypothetical protein [Bacteroidota bacterium]
MSAITKNTISKSERKKRVNRLLDLIDGANESIELSRETGSEFLVKQYLHLKKKYLDELSAVLAEFNVQIEIKEAA